MTPRGVTFIDEVDGRAARRTVTATAVIVGAGNGHGSAVTVAVVSN